MQYLIKVKNAVLEILFPPVCLNCQKYVSQEENYLCHLCVTKIFINKTVICPTCRTRLADNKKTCHKKSIFTLAAAAFYDDEVIKNLIWRLKYQKQRAAVKPLVKILLKHINFVGLVGPAGPLKPVNTLLVPIPLHPNREKQRGFNQSFLIAEELSKNLNIPLVEALKREKDTKAQAEIEDFEKRKKNISECFKIQYFGSFTSEVLKNKNILLLDDVFTSGATMSEAAKILKSAGVKKIIGLVAARVR